MLVFFLLLGYCAYCATVLEILFNREPKEAP